MLIAMASTHMTTLVSTRAAAWETSGIRRRNGGDGMNWSQNSTPARKKLACISQMCTSWLFSARSNSTGMCQNTITKLNVKTATHGRSRKLVTARSGRVQPLRNAVAVAVRPRCPGRPSSSGCHGAPATTSVGAANMSSRCWVMCTKK